MLKIEITDDAVVAAFNRLIATGASPQGALMGIGEVVADFTKRRFVDSADPYGTPWEQNSDTTLRAVLHRSGKNFTKKGELSKRGQTVLAGKKPLIGESKTLSTQIHYTVIGDDSVVISSSAVQAAMMHFGGTKAEFPHLWGDIPARPIFPDETRGLPDELNRDISDVLRAALESAVNG